MDWPLFAPLPDVLGLLPVLGTLCLGFGYGFMDHPRRMFVYRHPLTAEGRDALSRTGVALYQAWGFVLSVVGVGAWTWLALGTTRLPPLAAAGAGAVVATGGVVLARADTRRRQRVGLGVAVVGLGVAVGGLTAPLFA